MYALFLKYTTPVSDAFAPFLARDFHSSLLRRRSCPYLRHHQSYVSTLITPTRPWQSPSQADSQAGR
jgi:hypothetical protein